MTDKERKALMATLDILYAAGFSYDQLRATAQKIGLEWDLAPI